MCDITTNATTLLCETKNDSNSTLKNKKSIPTLEVENLVKEREKLFEAMKQIEIKLVEKCNEYNDVIVKEYKMKLDSLTNKTKCVICLDVIGEKNTSTTKCGHQFCLTCLHGSLKISNKCPCCRSKILKKKPAKPLVKLNKKIAIQMINQETRGWDWNLMIESYTSFPINARIALKSDLQRFGLELTKQIMAFQINGDDSDYEIYDDDEDEDEENDTIVDLIEDSDDDEGSGEEV